MYLFFDTETTGLPRSWKAPVTDLNNWPRLVQLAYLYYDEKGNKISGGDFIIKPDGFIIPADVTRIHGISHEKAVNEGVLLNDVLLNFQPLIEEAEILVAHNMSFDEKIVGAEFLRVGMTNSIPVKRKICTIAQQIFVEFMARTDLSGQNFQNYITNFSELVLKKHTMQQLISMPPQNVSGN